MGKPRPFTIRILIKITIFKMMAVFTVLLSVTLKIGALTKLGLFFSLVCFIHVFDQTLAEHLYHDKGLLMYQSPITVCQWNWLNVEQSLTRCSLVFITC